MTKTTQAQAVRGLDTPEQNQVSVTTLDTTTADVLSLKLYNLTEIVKLAAFAAEARRTLSGIQDVMHYRPEMREAITNNVNSSANWSEMSDNTGDVLHYVANELQDVNSEFTGAVYALARAVKKGGAA